MTSSAARIFDVWEGDEFTFCNIVSIKENTVHIDGILDNDVLPLIITSKANEAEILGRSANEYNVIISDEPLSIPDQLLIKSASPQDYRTTTENTLKTAEIVLIIVKIVGAMIILVVMMLAGMIVEENRRNISMPEVLGYRRAEIRSMILSSNHLIVPFGFLPGVPLSSMIVQSSAKNKRDTDVDRIERKDVCNKLCIYTRRIYHFAFNIRQKDKKQGSCGVPEGQPSVNCGRQQKRISKTWQEKYRLHDRTAEKHRRYYPPRLSTRRTLHWNK